MSAETVVAISAVVIALAALLLTTFQAHETRKHNRLSVMPVLIMGTGWSSGGSAGIRVQNVGLGPGRIVESEIWKDGRLLGSIDRSGLDRLGELLETGGAGVSFISLSAGTTVEPGYDEHILKLTPYDPEEHADFIELITAGLHVKVIYESLYGERMEPMWIGPTHHGEPDLESGDA